MALEPAHHVLAHRVEPQRLVFGQRQHAVPVRVELLQPRGAAGVDLLLGQRAVAVRVIDLDQLQHPQLRMHVAVPALATHAARPAHAHAHPVMPHHRALHAAMCAMPVAAGSRQKGNGHGGGQGRGGDDDLPGHEFCSICSD